MIIKFNYLEDFETRIFPFTGKNECVIVPIEGKEYSKCTNPKMWATRDDDPATRGLANSKKDPDLSERSGRLGECACSKVFGCEVDFRYIRGGDDGIDFTLLGKKFDVKTSKNLANARRYRKNFIKGKKGTYEYPLLPDAYISAFVLDEDKEVGRAEVVLVGWMSKRRLINLHSDGLHASPVYPILENYELHFSELSSIVALIDKAQNAEAKDLPA